MRQRQIHRSIRVDSSRRHLCLCRDKSQQCQHFPRFHTINQKDLIDEGRPLKLSYLRNVAQVSGIAVCVNDIHQLGIGSIEPRSRANIEAIPRVGNVVKKQRASRVHGRYSVKHFRPRSLQKFASQTANMSTKTMSSTMDIEVTSHHTVHVSHQLKYGLGHVPIISPTLCKAQKRHKVPGVGSSCMIRKNLHKSPAPT